MDFDSRYTLLQLFAETTSSEEHCISFEGIHLPQIPGKQLFSLVKRYLCVTSLVDQLSSEQPDHSERSRLQRQFDFSMAMGSLICELARVMGWVTEWAPSAEPAREDEQPRVVRSIFQPKAPPYTSLQVVAAAPLRPVAPKKKGGKQFMSPSDFPCRSTYVDYIQEALKPGMSVRMLEDYDEVSAGDEGVYRQSNNGMPPMQVLWGSTGRTYWVHWHMVEITGCGEQVEEDAQEKAACALSDTLTVSPDPALGSQIPLSVPRSRSRFPDPALGSQIPLSGSQIPLSGSQIPLSGSQIPLSGPLIPLSGPRSRSRFPDPALGSQIPLSGPQIPWPMLYNRCHARTRL
ncbi:cullin-9-like, partial [Ascaphus truei]|uniref:cullin-9-like n=1 Tax=Ascaphus truei TaxID=8439 RepID=UPI003F590B89